MLTIQAPQPQNHSQIPAPDILSLYEEMLDQRQVQAKAKPYFLRWAKTWFTTADPETSSGTLEFFHALGRRPNLPAWQFQQAVRAVAWLARDILQISWAVSFDWRGLADQAKPLEPTHRTHVREATPIVATNTLAPSTEPLPDTHMPEALMRKYPNASREWPWQFLFPSATLCPNPRTGRIARYHFHDASMQRQFKEAVRKARLSKPATCHTLRHSITPLRFGGLPATPVTFPPKAALSRGCCNPSP